MQVLFDAFWDGEYWCARGTSHDIFTQGKNLDELIKNVKEAVEAHFGEDIMDGITIIIRIIVEVHPIETSYS
ncbi:MAG: type II toxin-antitoxin system HicB family antitoxin [Candidatus Njordarchaeota archaeon]